MTLLREWARLDARWYEDPVILEAAEVCASAFHLWPVLVAKAKHDSHETTNPLGVFTLTVRRLAMDAWIPVEDVRPALDALVDGEVITYSVEGVNRLRISLIGFAKWQTPRKSNAETKERMRWITSREKALLSHAEGMEAASAVHIDVEGEVEDKSTNVLSSPSGKPKNDNARLLFDHWLTTTGRNPNQNRLTKKRRMMVNGRIADGYSFDMLRQAIDGIAASPWHRGENPSGTRYDTFDFIFRSGENVEKGVERSVGAANGAAAGMTSEQQALLRSLQSGGAA